MTEPCTTINGGEATFEGAALRKKNHFYADGMARIVSAASF